MSDEWRLTPGMPLDDEIALREACLAGLRAYAAQIRRERERELRHLCIQSVTADDGTEYRAGISRISGSNPNFAELRDFFSPISADVSGDIDHATWPEDDPNLNGENDGDDDDAA